MQIVKFGQILKRGNTLDFSGGSLANCQFKQNVESFVESFVWEIIN